MKLIHLLMLSGLILTAAGCGCPPCQPCELPPVPELTSLRAELAKPPELPVDLILCPVTESPRIPSRLQAKLFDTAVNTGVNRATKLLQQSLNQLKPEAALVIDGALGPKTMAAMCGLSEQAILIVYVEKQSAFYLSLVEKKPSQAKFLKGWLRRAEWVPQ